MWNFLRALVGTAQPRSRGLYDGQPFFCLTCGKSLDEPHCERHSPESVKQAMDRANRYTKRRACA